MVIVTPPLLPLKRQPGVVVMHLHDRLRVRARVDCTAPSTESERIHANLRFVHCYFEARLPKLEGAADSSARFTGMEGRPLF